MTMNFNQNFPPPKAFTSSLQLVSTNYALRCDAKFADSTFLGIDKTIREAGCFLLGDFLPMPFVKGIQPDSLDQPLDDSVPVINTLSIQALSLRVQDCRHISRDDFDSISEERKVKKGDVLLTVDGGVSIGKTCLFDEEGDFTVDSHVVILRPEGISSLALCYLLASPLGQLQFRRAESGASGQTTVTEDDVRRFIFPNALLKTIDQVAKDIEKERASITAARRKLNEQESTIWKKLESFSVV
jgi:hypothetical protein